MFSRLKDYSRLSASHHRSEPVQSKRVNKLAWLSSRSYKLKEDHTLHFPQPPTYLPDSFASAYPGDRSFEDTSFTLNPDNLRLKVPSDEASENEKDPNSFTPTTRVQSLSGNSVFETVKRSVLPISLNRLKTFTKSAFRTYLHTPATETSVLSSFRAEQIQPGRYSPDDPSLELPRRLKRFTSTFERPSPNLSPGASASCPNPFDYEFVDPSELTASPSPLLRPDLLTPSARSSFVPPSPSWLSRNVQLLEPSHYLTPQSPPSPAPLPIPPRLLVSSFCELPSLSPLEIAESWFNRPDPFSHLQPNPSTYSLSPGVTRNSSTASKCSTRTNLLSHLPRGKENRLESPFAKVSFAFCGFGGHLTHFRKIPDVSTVLLHLPHLTLT